ncbi:DMT family transporter [Roseobacteraceae bacterium S113]
MPREASAKHQSSFQTTHEHPSKLMGLAWMTTAITIWASWLVLTSSGVTTDLSPIDLAGLRALVPALVLAPLLWRGRHDVANLGAKNILLLSAYGAPFTLCVGYGLSHAPVAHAGAMVPSLMPVCVTLIGWLVLRRQVSISHFASAVLIVAGASAIAFRPAAVSHPGDLWIGHILFLTAALFWACFTLTLQRQPIAPFLATALVGAISLIGLAPFWILAGLSTMADASLPDMAFQFVFQGIITGLLSLYAFGKALALLGPLATRLSAVTPAVATGLAIPVLSQVPDLYEIASLALVIGGLLVAVRPSRATRNDISRSAFRN